MFSMPCILGSAEQGLHNSHCQTLSNGLCVLLLYALYRKFYFITGFFMEASQSRSRTDLSITVTPQIIVTPFRRNDLYAIRICFNWAKAFCINAIFKKVMLFSFTNLGFIRLEFSSSPEMPLSIRDRLTCYE